MTEETLGRRIAARRKTLGLTQDALAERLGVTAQAVSKWENDQSCPDISLLPRLAEIFDVTTDELLGVQRKEEAREKTGEEPVPAPAPPEAVPAEVQAPVQERQESPQQTMGIGIALWLLLTGAVLLAPKLLPLLFEVPVWSALSMTALLVFGAMGVYPRFSLFRLGCGLTGGYYLYVALFQPAVRLNEELVLPLLLLYFGAGLLVDSIRGRRVPAGHLEMAEIGRNSCDCGENTFDCQTCFNSAHRIIRLPCLQGGSGKVTFGELTIDLHECLTLAEGARVSLECSFGELMLLVPRGWRLDSTNKTAFGVIQELGSPDREADDVLKLDACVRFGELRIKYL